MKSTSTIAALFALLILGLESTSGLSVTIFNHTYGQKNQTEKIIANNNAVPKCNDEDGGHPCSH
jgi:nitrate reductase gamma subunit